MLSHVQVITINLHSFSVRPGRTFYSFHSWQLSSPPSTPYISVIILHLLLLLTSVSSHSSPPSTPFIHDISYSTCSAIMYYVIISLPVSSTQSALPAPLGRGFYSVRTTYPPLVFRLDPASADVRELPGMSRRPYWPPSCWGGA